MVTYAKKSDKHKGEIMLKHIVLFKFKPDTKEDDIINAEKGLAGLPSRISEIKRYEFGRNVVQTDRSYDFALVSEFDDIEALKRYRMHPYHLAVVNQLGMISESIISVDFV